MELMSYYSSGWSLVLMGLAEGIVFPWVYGKLLIKIFLKYNNIILMWIYLCIFKSYMLCLFYTNKF